MADDGHATLRNELAGSASMYLRRQARDPVWWQNWGEAAFKRAARLHRPILISIGYSACHWCHVMARESFSDHATAALMNDLFVCIKIDREERPDLDRHYLAEMGRRGRPTGWPLTIFLSSDGTLVDGGGYYPAEPRFGLPRFTDVLPSMAVACRAHGRNETAAPVLVAGRSAAAGAVADGLLDHVCRALVDGIDPLYGGFGQDGPKFLHPAGHELLLRAWRRTGRQSYLEAASVSVAHLVDGAVFDHVGGGFHRYASDDCWHVPHFEKMLTDNALMIRLCTQLWQATGRQLFADRVAATIGWLLREMRAEDGGLCASLSADTTDGEGAYYLWTADELRELFKDEHEVFLRSFEATPQPGRSDRLVLSVRHDPGGSGPAGDVAAWRAVLAEAQASRTRPERDEACLADWSGLAVTALVEAGFAFDRNDWIEAASEVFEATLSLLSRGTRLAHHAGRGPRRADGPSQPVALLDDYATMIQAALALYEASGSPALLRRVHEWEAVLEAEYWDPSSGGYFLTPAGTDQHVPRQIPIDETVSSAGNGIMLGVLARLFGLTGGARYHDHFKATLRRYGTAFTRAPLQVATALCHAQALDRLLQIVVVGDRMALQSMRRGIFECYLPDRLLLMVDDQVLDEDHPGYGKAAPVGKAAAYVCCGRSCLPPAGDADTLRMQLIDMMSRNDTTAVSS